MKSTCHNSQIIKDNLGNKYCEYCLKHNPKPIKAKEWTLYTIFILLLLGIYSFSEAPNIKNILKFNTITDDTCDIQLNDSSLLAFLISNNSPCPSLGLAQIKLESSLNGKNYNSSIAHTNHNIAGIKTSKRWKYSSGYKNGYNNYNSYKLCLLDFIEIQKIYTKNINHRYAEDIKYIDKLKNVK